jgi:hypothetical protein
MGMLLGLLWAGALPSFVHAQGSTDPVPLYQASPASPGQGMPGGMPAVPAMAPMAGYAPGMGAGGPPCGPGGDCGLVTRWFHTGYDLSDDCWHYYVNGGYIGLMRSRMKDYELAVRDPEAFDDGFPPPAGSPRLLGFDSLKTGMSSGARATLGIYSEDVCWEIGGMLVPRVHNAISITDPGRISSFFFNEPIGFQGTNPGLWDNADRMTLSLNSRMVGGEANMRWFMRGEDEAVEVFCGCRYLDYDEYLSIFTDDDSIQFSPDPLSVATYSTRAKNHLFGLSAGVSMHGWFCDCLALGFDARGSWMANYATTGVSLIRGDGLVGFDGSLNKWGFTQIYEAGLFLELAGDRCRLRGGYQGMLLLHLAIAQDQVDFDLGNQRGRGDMFGTVWYHGPVATLEFIF